MQTSRVHTPKKVFPTLQSGTDPSEGIDFKAYAVTRLRRSGIRLMIGNDAPWHADESGQYYTIASDDAFLSELPFEIAYISDHVTRYVIGNWYTFWVFDRDDLWPDGTSRQSKAIVLARRVKLERMKWIEAEGRYRKDWYYFYQVEKIPSLSYTPVPIGHYTDYECDLWLAEHSATTSKENPYVITYLDKNRGEDV